MFDLILLKPVLVGLHLGFAILGIDAFVWLLGEYVADSKSLLRHRLAAIIGVGAFLISWMIGGYYYVMYYGSIVKPIILKGAAPWAHEVAMEAKEHIFLFLIPLALTAFMLTLVNPNELTKLSLKKPAMRLAGLIAGLGLLIGAMGYIISAAARWG